MDIELKGKFDDLDDLLSGGYISREEFAAARENLLIEAGFDVSPREGGFLGGPSFRRSGDGEGRSGCGCFLVLLVMLAALFGCFLALPDGILKGIPIVGNLLEGQGIQEMRQSVTRFIDDLRGNPAPVGEPVSVTPPPSLDGGGKESIIDKDDGNKDGGDRDGERRNSRRTRRRMPVRQRAAEYEDNGESGDEEER